MSSHLSSEAPQPNATTSNAANPDSVIAANVYEAPAIESVLSPGDLQREVLYAGLLISDPDPEI